MFKKIVLGLIFTGMTAGLVYGGIYRTAARLETTGESSRQGEGREQNERLYLNRQESKDQSQNDGKGNNRTGNGGFGTQDFEPDSQSEQDEVFIIFGFAGEVTPDLLSLVTDDSSTLLIENRAWRYAQEEGFAASIGDQIILSGFFDDAGAFEVVSLENLATGIIVTICDESGRPLWAGNGRGGQNGRST